MGLRRFRSRDRWRPGQCACGAAFGRTRCCHSGPGLAAGPRRDDGRLRRSRCHHGAEAGYQGNRGERPWRARKCAERDRARGLRFLSEAGRHRPAGPDRAACVQPPPYRGGKPQIGGEGGRGEHCPWQPDHRGAGNDQGCAHYRACGQHKHFRDVARRQRHRQGTAGARRSRFERSPERQLRGDKLRRDPGKPAGKRAVRAREGRFYRSGEDYRRQDRTG